ncbi:MAG: hypothetical protein [Siphoviridae sp. ctjeG17]|nr:MAG: hypothetical protein [Siphoviridae sp. ctjeG17]
MGNSRKMEHKVVGQVQFPQGWEKTFRCVRSDGSVVLSRAVPRTPEEIKAAEERLQTKLKIARKIAVERMATRGIKEKILDNESLAQYRKRCAIIAATQRNEAKEQHFKERTKERAEKLLKQRQEIEAKLKQISK